MAQICGKMSRVNATFKIKSVQQVQKDDDGFYKPLPNTSEWIDGCECYVEKHIPAKQIIGVDGQVYTYNYTVFIPKHYNGNLELTQEMQLIYNETGKVETLIIQGVDDANRKHIEVWG